MTDDEKIIYALGLSMYRSLGQFDLSAAEMDILKKALTDAAAGKPAEDIQTWGPKIQDLATSRAARVAEKQKALSAAFLAKVAASSGHEQASIVCFLLGFALLIPGAYGLLDTIRGRGETIATIGALLTTIGAAAFAGLECSGIANIGVARSVPAAQAARIVTEMGNVGAAGAVFLLGLALPVGMILVTIGIRRARRAPLWVPIVTALGFLIVMFVESTLGGVAGDVLMLAALGYLGVRRLDGDADSA